MPFLKENGLISVLAALCFITVAFYLSFESASKRVYAKISQTRIIAEPYQAYTEWEKEGVKGRIVFLFDRSLNADPTAYSGSPDEKLKVLSDNYLYVAFRRNMVRKIYHIIPDASWSEVERNLTGNPFVQSINGIFRITIEGMPVMIMRLRDIPAIGETVLININGTVWDNAGKKAILGLLEKRVITSDLITVSGDLSHMPVNEVQEYENGR